MTDEWCMDGHGGRAEPGNHVHAKPISWTAPVLKSLDLSGVNLAKAASVIDRTIARNAMLKASGGTAELWRQIQMTVGSAISVRDYGRVPSESLVAPLAKDLVNLVRAIWGPLTAVETPSDELTQAIEQGERELASLHVRSVLPGQKVKSGTAEEWDALNRGKRMKGPMETVSHRIPSSTEESATILLAGVDKRHVRRQNP